MKKKIIIRKKFLTFLLIYFVLVTSNFSILTLSKYVGIIGKSGTATVAKWEVSTDTSDNTSDTLNMIIGNTQESYIIKITSTSDVKAIYSITLSNLPSGLEVMLDNGNYQTQVNNTITFNNVGYINANDTTRTKTHTLTFNVPIGTSSIDASNIDIDVVFNQINPTSN